MIFKQTFYALLLSFMIFGCSKPDQTIPQVNEFIAQQQIDKTNNQWKTQLTQPEQFTFTEGKVYYWDLTTSAGDISIELFHDVAPMHVSSTMYLTQLGFYDDLIFHRIIPNFMAQGGDPLGSGRGNPGYKYAGEFDAANQRAKHHKAGMLSMANAGKNTDGSQFFITFNATPHLDGRHTVFGEVVKGLEDVLPNLQKLGSRSGKTSTEVKIVTATIRVEDIKDVKVTTVASEAVK
ncbi:MAG: peptidylprolyl isomerase [Thalassotalea sp.]